MRLAHLGPEAPDERHRRYGVDRGIQAEPKERQAVSRQADENGGPAEDPVDPDAQDGQGDGQPEQRRPIALRPIVAPHRSSARTQALTDDRVDLERRAAHVAQRRDDLLGAAGAELRVESRAGP